MHLRRRQLAFGLAGICVRPLGQGLIPQTISVTALATTDARTHVHTCKNRSHFPFVAHSGRSSDEQVFCTSSLLDRDALPSVALSSLYYFHSGDVEMLRHAVSLVMGSAVGS